MLSRIDLQSPVHPDADPRAEHEALVAHARELIANPDYPTGAIVEELAEMLAHRAAVQTAENTLN